jgi:hypothetical protein
MSIDPEIKRILDKRLASGEISKKEYRELTSEVTSLPAQDDQISDSIIVPAVIANAPRAQESEQRRAIVETKSEFLGVGCVWQGVGIILCFSLMHFLTSLAGLAYFSASWPELSCMYMGGEGRRDLRVLCVKRRSEKEHGFAPTAMRC